MAVLLMNERLLSLISLIQAKKKLAQQESRFGLSEDWLKDTENYFNALPVELIKELGLKKNKYCFEALLAFKITKEMLNCESDKLDEDSRFQFSYPGE
ncbi:hypothetical protein REH81_06330 [Vibrio rotiferianus]